MHRFWQLTLGITLGMLGLIFSSQPVHAAEIAIDQSTPANSATGVGVDAASKGISFHFNVHTTAPTACYAAERTFTQNTVTLSDEHGNRVPLYNVSYNNKLEASNIAGISYGNFTLSNVEAGFELNPSTKYTLSLKGGSDGSGIRLNCDDGSANYLPFSGYSMTFTTGPDTVAPLILYLTSHPTTTAATISWETSQNATSTVVYGTSPGFGQSSGSTPATSTRQSVLLSDLSAGTTYYYQARSSDAAGNLSTANGQFTTLAIDHIAVTGLTGHEATITWDTNQPTDSFVDYGPTTTYLRRAGIANSATSHNVRLSNLDANATYHFRIKATTADGTSYSADRLFTTTNVEAVPNVSAPPEGFIDQPIPDNEKLNLINDGGQSKVLGASSAAVLTTGKPAPTNVPVLAAIAKPYGWATWLIVPLLLILLLGAVLVLLTQHHVRLRRAIERVDARG